MAIYELSFLLFPQLTPQVESLGREKRQKIIKAKKRKDVNKKVKIITAKQARREREGERGRRAEAEAGCRVGMSGHSGNPKISGWIFRVFEISGFDN